MNLIHHEQSRSAGSEDLSSPRGLEVESSWGKECVPRASQGVEDVEGVEGV